jgi:hypothetical protein
MQVEVVDWQQEGIITRQLPVEQGCPEESLLHIK